MATNLTQTIWITGASSGIGEACAYCYAAQKNNLLLTATSANKLHSVADKCRKLGAQVIVLQFDLQEIDNISALVKMAWEQFNGIDVLFCNAGISQRTTVADTSLAMVRKIMDINFYAPVVLSKEILPFMLKNGRGNIAVTTSIAGYFGFPLRCAYSASKHALYGFFETLQAEYASYGLCVTLVCPGRVQSQISVNALDKGGSKHGVMDPGQAGGLSAEKAAAKIVRAIRNGKREVLVGKKELIMVYVKRFFPAIAAFIARRIKPM